MRKQSKRVNDKRKDYKTGRPGIRRSRNEENCENSSSDNSSTRGGNDPAWYAQTPELLRDSASLPFSHAAGTTARVNYRNILGDTVDTFLEGSFTSPGIMTLQLVPMPGYATDPTSPLNIASTSLYSFIRHANSGSANYDSPDLMLYCLAMGQVYSYINWLIRIYGSMFVYANMNRYLPKGLLIAQHVDFDDINQNLADFRYGINVLIHQAASMAVPATLTYFQRLAFLFSNIYAEGESIKSQLYMYTPVGFMQFQETAETTGGSLTYIPLPGIGGSSLLTCKQLLAYGQSLLSPILAAEDCGIMSGDILKAYGSAGVLKLSPIPEMYQIIPVTNLEVLEQFQNANFVSNIQTANITQDPNLNCLVTTFKVASPKHPNTTEYAINVPEDHILTTILTEPNAGDVIERTRMMLSVRDCTVVGDNIIWTIDGCSEVATACHIYVMQPTGAPNPGYGFVDVPLPQTYIVDPNGNALSGTLNVAIIAAHCYAENFKFHPVMYYYTAASSEANTLTLTGFALDLDNYTIVHKDTLDQMNLAALLSMFNVNSIAKAYN